VDELQYEIAGEDNCKILEERGGEGEWLACLCLEKRALNLGF
jgi:hypothetical protein